MNKTTKINFLSPNVPGSMLRGRNWRVLICVPPPMVMGQGLDTTTTSHQHPLKIHDFVAMNGQAKEITCVLTGKTLFISVCAAKQVTQNCETLTEKKKHQKERQKIKCTSELGPQVVSLWRCQGMSNTLSNGRHFGWHCWWH